jgi:hypothetical protein
MKTNLYRFLHSRPILGVLISKHEVGWFDGGCLILAQALKSWLCAELVLIRSDNHESFDHAVVAIKNPDDRKDVIFIDADGVSDEYEILERWTRREALLNPRICRNCRSLYQDRALSLWLARQLRVRFGEPKGNIISVLGRANRPRHEYMRFFPRATAQIIAHSHGFCSPQSASRILADASSGRENGTEWCTICYAGNAALAVTDALQSRRDHRDGMRSYARAISIVRASMETCGRL